MRNLKEESLRNRKNERENQRQVKIGDFFFCLWSGGKRKSSLLRLIVTSRPQRRWKHGRCVSPMSSFNHAVTPGGLVDKSEIKVNERSDSKGAQQQLCCPTRTQIHAHIHAGTHKLLNREQRSSRWALSWLTVTHWWEQNSTCFCFLSFSHWQNTNHY